MASSGHTCTLKVTGSAVAVTAEAAAVLVPYTVYRITNAARRVIDPASSVTVKVNGVAVGAGTYSLNYLFGAVTFGSALSALDVVTLDFSYLPLLSLAEVRSFELSVSSAMLETTVMDSATVARTKMAGLQDASGNFAGLDPLTTDLDPGAGAVRVFQEWFDAGANRLIEVGFPGGTKFRAFAVLPDVKVSSGFDALVESTVNWQASARTGTGRSDASAFGIGT